MTFADGRILIWDETVLNWLEWSEVGTRDSANTQDHSVNGDGSIETISI